MPLPIIATLVFLFGYVMYNLVINKKRPTTTTPRTPAVSTPQKRAWFGKLLLPTVFILAGAGMWWFENHHAEKNTIKPNEEWVFIWSLSINQYDERGSNGDNLEVRIVKNDSESLCFDTHYIYAGSMETGRNQLSKHGDKMVGSWCQDNPRDGGSIYLKKADDQTWFGKFEDRKGRTYPCMLKRK